MVTLIDSIDTRPRHPEKAHRPENEILRKPDWIRVKAPGSPIYKETQQIAAVLQTAGRGLHYRR